MQQRPAGIVTFNGKSFDVPILESRFAYHRMPSPLDRLWHVDLLHPSRRLWQGVDGTLGGLERDIVGLRRDGDVPGAEIPGRYVAYLRGAAASLLEPVMEHNRLDLVSLGALTGWACRVIDEGPRSAYQALGLGRLLGKIGRHDDAVACYERAAGGANGASVTSAADAVSAEALYRLACYWRRRRRHAAAADAWRRLLELRYPPPQVRA